MNKVFVVSYIFCDNQNSFESNESKVFSTLEKANKDLQNYVKVFKDNIVAAEGIKDENSSTSWFEFSDGCSTTITIEEQVIE